MIDQNESDIFHHLNTQPTRMLEISRAAESVSNLSGTPLLKTNCEKSLRERANKLCRDYLHGAWLGVQPQEMILKKVSGGLSNLLYYCELPEGVESCNGEPSRLLLRLYGKVNGERAFETLITESVIFTLLSESQRGPRLYGVFSGGRLEEYIPARPLLTQELSDPAFVPYIADKMAQIHLMDVPINKQPKWLWQTMQGWISQIENIIATNDVIDESQEMIDTLKHLNLTEEYNWLKDYLTSVESPVVFCHNDLQEGNILLREIKPSNEPDQFTGKYPNFPTSSDNLVVIDFEYCSYNYRGFDFANHFCEYVYDYSNQEPPYYWQRNDLEADVKQKEHFINAYLEAIKKYPEYKEKEKDNLSSILRETDAFILASHFFWGLWSAVNSTGSEIIFDYWGFGECRFQEYYKYKNKIIPLNTNN